MLRTGNSTNVSTLASPDLLRSEMLNAQLVTDVRLVLVDLDGCLISQERAFPDAAGFVEACSGRLWVISNNSTHSAQTLTSSLHALGLAIHPDRVLLAGEQTLRHLKRTRPEHSIALYASDTLQDLARKLGLRIVAKDPDIVLLCRDPGFSFKKLETAVGQIQNGARLWVSNTDLTHPALDGRPLPETGALLAAIHAVAGPVDFDCIGKPNIHMARIAIERTGVPTHDAVFVGDSEDTDGAIAKAARIPFLHLVRRGVA